MKYYAIIVAGGSGSRMETSTPKQFLLLDGLPVLMHTIRAFHESSMQPEIILALNQSYNSLWTELCTTHSFDIPHKIIPGGSQRFESVKNALSQISEESVTAVHDAVRPIISDDLISRCYRHAEEHESAIPVVGSRDSLRRKVNNNTVALNRDEILIVQTPQIFKSGILKKAYQQSFSGEFTDDASVVEKAGFKVSTVYGDLRNIKITFREDLEIASLFLKSGR
ncbi:2-C-methyl-D-erythritol 4-phosphate cytidylyltransferase [Desertivirga xinjiangensis]|uniref:2-C-methyl-D-erythritol 4-phosphate cytidylyltransferase n=1 Tax=Desertivirga xinjiangensis TaxID=539206 RepID=UPI00210EF153|nr:2-C-methyl-D-erythritol 4-phosphate cytidylyltransferase [Pedobacter xinjiangensis]